MFEYSKEISHFPFHNWILGCSATRASKVLLGYIYIVSCWYNKSKELYVAIVTIYWVVGNFTSLKFKYCIPWPSANSLQGRRKVLKRGTALIIFFARFARKHSFTFSIATCNIIIHNCTSISGIPLISKPCLPRPHRRVKEYPALPKNEYFVPLSKCTADFSAFLQHEMMTAFPPHH